jgi:hypothetical protein
MKQSGGIMGLMRSITISSNGEYTAVDEWTSKTVDGVLSNDELAELQSLITDWQFTAAPHPAVCADCFVYQFRIQRGGERLSFQLDDITLPDSSAGELTAYLVNLLNKLLR